jgi:tRNA(Ile2) C34 agmatinyltransferase TiaS
MATKAKKKPAPEYYEPEPMPCPECGGEISADSQGGQCVKCGWRPTDAGKEGA